MTQTVTTTSPNPSITVRTTGPATEIIIRTALARWFRACLWAILPAFFVLVPMACVLSGGLPHPWTLVPVITVVVVLLVLLLLGFIAIANAVTSVTLLIDGETLHVRPAGGHYAIPIRDIRRISLSTHPRRRLDVNPSEPPYRLFSRCYPVSLDIDTVAGRLQFMRGRSPGDVPPLLATLSPLLDLPPSPTYPSPPVTATSGVHSRAETVGLRLLATICLLVAGGLSYWELVPAFRSRHWPATPGQVTHSHWERTESVDSKHVPTYKAEATYTYAVDYNTYTNDRIAFGRDNPDDAIRDYLQSHPTGSAATVYYDPRNPAHSTLIPGPGLIDWCLAGTAALLLIPLPLLRLRATPADQLQLVDRYRVKPGTNKQPPTLESVAAETSNLPRWTTPPDAFEQGFRTRRRTCILIAVRLTAVLLLIEYAFYAYLLPHIPVIFDRSRLVLPLVGMNLMAIAPFVFGAIARGKPAEFRLTPDGIRMPSRERPLLRYKTIDSFTVTHDSAPPHAATLNLHTRDGITRIIPLPSTLAEEIVTEVSRHLPQRPPSQRYSALRRRDWLLGLIVTTAYTVAVGVLLRHVIHALPREWAGLIILAGFTILGPGSVTAIVLNRRRATAQLYGLAMAFNMIGGLSTLIYSALPKVMATLQ